MVMPFNRQHPRPRNNSKLRILQWNVNSIKGKKNILQEALISSNIDVAVLQETKHIENKFPKIKPYEPPHEIPRGRNCHGLAILVNEHTTKMEKVDIEVEDDNLEVIAAKITTSTQQVYIYNIYIYGYRRVDFEALFAKHTANAPAIWLGDFNAHHELWGSHKINTNGTALAEALGEEDITILNQPTPTHKRGGIIDLTLVSSNIANNCHWRINDDLSSDHFSILLDIQQHAPESEEEVNPPEHIIYNFKRANWDKFNPKLLEEFASIPDQVYEDIDAYDSKILASILAAAEEACPKITNKPRRPDYWFQNEQCREIKAIVNRCNKLYRKHRTPELLADLRDAQAEKARVYYKAKEDSWKRWCDNIDHKKTLTEMWNCVRMAQGKSKGKYSHPRPHEEAERLADMYQSRSASHIAPVAAAPVALAPVAPIPVAPVAQAPAAPVALAPAAPILVTPRAPPRWSLVMPVIAPVPVVPVVPDSNRRKTVREFMAEWRAHNKQSRNKRAANANAGVPASNHQLSASNQSDRANGMQTSEAAPGITRTCMTPIQHTAISIEPRGSLLSTPGNQSIHNTPYSTPPEAAPGSTRPYITSNQHMPIASEPRVSLPTTPGNHSIQNTPNIIRVSLPTTPGNQSIQNTPHSTPPALSPTTPPPPIEYIIDDTIQDINNDDITSQELNAAIKRVKIKAPGEDGISNIVYKNMSEENRKYLLQLFNMSFSSSKLPAKWKTAVIAPIKKPADPTSPRPIALINNIAKLCENILNKRLKAVIGRPEPNSFGFTEQVGTTDAIAYLNALMQKHKNKCHVAFLDLEKAFESVPRDTIIDSLKRKKVSGKLLAWVKEYLTNRTATVRVGGVRSTPRLFENGTPQGSSISPTLFNAVMDQIAALPLGPNTKIIVYADDIAIVTFGGNSFYHLRNALSKVNAKCQEMGLKISNTKTKLMAVGKGEIRDTFMNGVKLAWVNEYRYLGAMIASNTKTTKHIEYITTKAQKALNAMKVISGASWGPRLALLRTIYIATVRSILEYGSIIYSPHNPLEELDKVQTAALRVMARAPRCTSKIALLMETRLIPMKLRVQTLRARYTRKLLNFEFEHPLRTLLEPVWQQDRSLFPDNGWLSDTVKFMDESNYPVYDPEFNINAKQQQIWAERIDAAECEQKTVAWLRKCANSHFQPDITLNRQDETDLLKLRLNYKFAPQYENCPLCQQPSGTIHILAECPETLLERNHLYDAVGREHIDFNTPETTAATILLRSEADKYWDLLQFRQEIGPNVFRRQNAFSTTS